MKRVLQVGGGITSAVTASLVHQQNLNVNITIWEKSRGVGGRMSTSRHPDNGEWTVDLGLQYITLSPLEVERHYSIWTALLERGLMAPLTSRVDGMKDLPEGTRHFMAPRGSSSLVKHFVVASGANVDINTRLSSLRAVGDEWEAVSEKGSSQKFDAVVLTMPAPQILQLEGDLFTDSDQSQDIKNKLGQVEYSSRFCAGLFYSTKDFPLIGWDMKYIRDDDVLRYVSLDHCRRNRDEEIASVVLHSHVQFGKKNVESSPQAMLPTMLQRFQDMFPSWPDPSFIKPHKWRYSQVVRGYPGSPGFITMNDTPLLLAAGDSFTTSNICGCIDSAKSTANKILQWAQM